MVQILCVNVSGKSDVSIFHKTGGKDKCSGNIRDIKRIQDDISRNEGIVME